ncbi:unnamed protein product [marine sediment metagenome]|uniref:Uncharacterized protein n=1 Tax=marine sediment metagenome TaxID=412755 RepID=X1LY51_9ZZZZ
MIQANLSLKEIYDLLCSKCRAKLVKLVAGRVTEAQIRKELEGKKK